MLMKEGNALQREYTQRPLRSNTIKPSSSVQGDAVTQGEEADIYFVLTQKEDHASFYNRSVLENIIECGFWNKEEKTVCLALFILARYKRSSELIDKIL